MTERIENGEGQPTNGEGRDEYAEHAGRFSIAFEPHLLVVGAAHAQFHVSRVVLLLEQRERGRHRDRTSFHSCCFVSSCDDWLVRLALVRVPRSSCIGMHTRTIVVFMVGFAVDGEVTRHMLDVVVVVVVVLALETSGSATTRSRLGQLADVHECRRAHEIIAPSVRPDRI